MPDDERENFLKNRLNALLRLIFGKYYDKNTPGYGSYTALVKLDYGYSGAELPSRGSSARVRHSSTSKP
jgi:hypothetical protein